MTLPERRLEAGIDPEFAVLNLYPAESGSETLRLLILSLRPVVVAKILYRSRAENFLPSESI